MVVALDGFPLALDLAGAYIGETGCSFGDYLRLYQNHRHALLARRASQDTQYLDSVATTWSLSFQKVEQANPAAADLLRLCAFLAPDQIPEALLREGVAHWPPVLCEAVADRLVFNQMLEDLLKFALIKRLVKKHMFSLHRLVQMVQRERMDQEEQQYWARCVICRVNAVFPRDPRDEIATWSQCQQYLEQVQVCDLMIRQYGLRFFEAADVLHRAAIYLCEQAVYTLAEPLFQQALSIWEQLLGPEHFQVAEPLSELAELYRRQHHDAEAEALLQRVLNIQEQQLGPHHPKVAVTLNNLAILFMQRALRIRERQLGQHHLNIAALLFNLGILYSVQGNYAEAEPLLQRALHLWEKQLGPQHPLLAYKLKSLAALYLKQDKYAEAELLYQRALHIWEQTPGSDPYEC